MKNKAIELLNSVSLRRTGPRLAVLETLLDADAPLTQDQIADIIGDSAPNKTTIYRTLTHLVETGLVHEAFLENRSQHYELAHHCGKQCCHPHFTCRQCEQTQCLTDVRADILRLPKGFSIQRQQIHIDGVCPDCRTRNKTKEIGQF
jgi:Fur family ferric uptake transcriptional regulator